uniref:cellulose 1,4-beta-cellobiosidase (non-reducing end) n=1 Tax=Arcella intermedia TaxID=1963864 RepID=A0A6B2LA92_9EUKA
MDIWEANSQATAYTPHPCNVSGPYRCSGGLCGDDADRYRGVCDKDGCDFNSWRMGDTSFYGTSMTVDTTKVFSVVTQFITSDGTDSGDLTEIRRYYVQNGVVIPNSYTNFVQIGKTNAVTSQFCTEQKTLFGDPNDFDAKGGLVAMGREMDKGMVLVMSLWDDHSVNMLWLDSNFPATASPSTPGVARGPCATTSGVPSDVESSSPGATVVFSNIKYGTIGSTFTQPTPTPSPPPSNPPATTPAPPTAPPTAAPTVPPTAAPTNAPSSGSQITNQNGAGAPSDNGGWIAFAVLLVLNVIVVVLVVVLARKGMLKMSSKGESV